MPSDSDTASSNFSGYEERSFSPNIFGLFLLSNEPMRAASLLIRREYQNPFPIPRVCDGVLDFSRQSLSLPRLNPALQRSKFKTKSFTKQYQAKRLRASLFQVVDWRYMSSVA